jgi:hypothetical protein
VWRLVAARWRLLRWLHGNMHALYAKLLIQPFQETVEHAWRIATVSPGMLTKYDREISSIERDAWPKMFCRLTWRGHMSKTSCVKQTSQGASFTASACGFGMA